MTAREPRPAWNRSRSFQLAARIVWMEVRHSAFVWALPLLAVLFVYDPFLTASHYPALWTVRASVVPDKFWPVCVPFAAGFAAWAGSREGRRNADDLLAATARPAWTRQLCSLAGTLAWVLAAFGAGVGVLYVSIARAATWGGPPIWPVAAVAASLTAICALAFTLGALFPGRFTAPIVAVGISVLTLAVFSRAVSEGGTSVFALSPDGIVPGNDAGRLLPRRTGRLDRPGHVLRRLHARGDRPARAVPAHRRRRLARRPRSRERGRSGAARRRDRRLRGRRRPRHRRVRAGRHGRGVAGHGRHRGSRPARLRRPTQPIPYPPVCADVAGGGFRVCLHPAFQRYLSQTANAFGPVIAELAGLPVTPVRAVEVAGQTLPPIVQQAGVDGDVTGNPPVYEFSMDGAIAQVPNAAQFQDGFQRDIVHAVVVGPIGQLTAGDNLVWNAGTPAQLAVVDGLLKAVGSQPYPACNPYALQCAPQPQVTAAAARFAALPAATRHAWLTANLAALKAGQISLARIP